MINFSYRFFISSILYFDSVPMCSHVPKSWHENNTIFIIISRWLNNQTRWKCDYSLVAIILYLNFKVTYAPRQLWWDSYLSVDNLDIVNSFCYIKHVITIMTYLYTIMQPMVFWSALYKVVKILIKNTHLCLN